MCTVVSFKSICCCCLQIYNILWAPAVLLPIVLLPIQEETNNNLITCCGWGEVIKSRMSSFIYEFNDLIVLWDDLLKCRGVVITFKSLNNKLSCLIFECGALLN